MVLSRRLNAHGLTNNHMANLSGLKAKLGTLIGDSFVHVPKLVEASEKVQSPNIGFAQKGLLKADILRRQAIIALDAAQVVHDDAHVVLDNARIVRDDAIIEHDVTSDDIVLGITARNLSKIMFPVFFLKTRS